jgi:hypothetical protein
MSRPAGSAEDAWYPPDDLIDEVDDVIKDVKAQELSRIAEVRPPS